MFVSAEIRWFWQDDCPANLRRWFDETYPTPGGGQLRIDQYLSQTNDSEISIKIRGGKSRVEIKGLVATRRSELVFLRLILKFGASGAFRRPRWK